MAFFRTKASKDFLLPSRLLVTSSAGSMSSITSMFTANRRRAGSRLVKTFFADRRRLGDAFAVGRVGTILLGCASRIDVWIRSKIFFCSSLVERKSNRRGTRVVSVTENDWWSAGEMGKTWSQNWAMLSFDTDAICTYLLKARGNILSRLSISFHVDPIEWIWSLATSLEAHRYSSKSDDADLLSHLITSMSSITPP